MSVSVQLELSEAFEIVVEDDVDADVDEGEELERSGGERCEECVGHIVVDGIERVCNQCGLVANEFDLDLAGGVRVDFDGQAGRTPRTHKVDRSRHDGGLSTTFRADSGKSARMRTWQDRVNEEQGRTLKDGFGEITRISDVVGVPRVVVEEACRLFKKARDKDVLNGHWDTDSVSAACVVVACRRHDAPVTTTDVSDAALVDKRNVDRALMGLRRQAGVVAPPLDPRVLIPRGVTELSGVEDAERVRRTALDMIGVGMRVNVLGGGETPQAAAAAAVYAAARVCGESVTQNTVSDVFDVGNNAIRRHYKALINSYLDN